MFKGASLYLLPLFFKYDDFEFLLTGKIRNNILVTHPRSLFDIFIRFHEIRFFSATHFSILYLTNTYIRSVLTLFSPKFLSFWLLT